jgi:Flp pilus assembly protein TadD
MLKRLISALYRRRALNAFVSGNFTEAHRLFLKLRKISPGERGIGYNLGLTSMALGLFEEAENYLLDAETEKNRPEVNNVLAELYYFWGKGALASSRYRNWDENRSPLRPVLVRKRMERCLLPDKMKEAAESYTALEKGSDAMQKSAFQEALSHLEEAVAKDETNYVAWNNLGTLYLNHAQDRKKAMNCFQKAFALADTPLIRRNLAKAGQGGKEA